MKYLDEFRDSDLAKGLIHKLQAVRLPEKVKLMEVCGTHTMAISRAGIRQVLPDSIELISGPGCPVCVTAQEDIDTIISLASVPGVIVTTFGDMMRVPGTKGSLLEAKAAGADVQVVYSTLDALDIARQNEDKQVVFMGIGFETTIPTVTRAVQLAFEDKIANFSVFFRAKTMPIPMEVLASDPEVGLDGFICPAHVSAIIGAKAYEPIVKKYKIPCVVTGFEPLDVLQGVCMLVKQIEQGEATVENEYSRVASYDGNKAALALMAEFCEPCDATWRGLGLIPGSGLKLKAEYADFDVDNKFNKINNVGTTLELSLPELSRQNDLQKACRCGDVLKGKIKPSECGLFAKACTPRNPIGPCMVSSEGSCAAYYRYER